MSNSIDSTIGYYNRSYKHFEKNRQNDQFVRLSNCDLMLRANTTDVDVFNMIFLGDEYRFPFKVWFPIKNILDCGANVGIFTAYMAQNYGANIEKIVCIEPDIVNYRQLQRVASQINDTDIHCYTLQVGVWNRDAMLEVYDPTGSEGSWGLRVRETDYQNGIYARSINTIADIFFKDEEYIDVCKIDIEGSELEVFTDKNANKWIERCKMIIVETHERFRPGSDEAVFTALKGWKCKKKGDNWFFLNPKFA